jgi:hypothetical protein
MKQFADNPLFQRNPILMMVNRPNQAWVADITHIPTDGGWLLGCCDGSVLKANRRMVDG